MTNDHDHADNSIRKSIGMSGYGDAPCARKKDKAI